ncbi:hypothetical protein FY534_13190 [Alicyclobacillus sp. TC]|uniref:hypothetical protein n=1 Tax=Alicyclobacillus sp. TC TaxID=2606450 RepID=UPI001934984E|nr:hypothetical protein [Alicyclobacillus sp. TC]QRF24473.1 hypothetical protein FY534_13190 [Alicyclobacillus sp. TC]
MLLGMVGVSASVGFLGAGLTTLEQEDFVAGHPQKSRWLGWRNKLAVISLWFCLLGGSTAEKIITEENFFHFTWLGSVILISMGLWILIEIDRNFIQDIHDEKVSVLIHEKMMLALAFSLENLSIGLSLGFLHEFISWAVIAGFLLALFLVLGSRMFQLSRKPSATHSEHSTIFFNRWMRIAISIAVSSLYLGLGIYHLF